MSHKTSQTSVPTSTDTAKSTPDESKPERMNCLYPLMYDNRSNRYTDEELLAMKKAAMRAHSKD